MKTIIEKISLAAVEFLIVLLFLMAFAKPADAQTFGGITTSYTTNYVRVVGPGNTNVQATVNGILYTNQMTVTLPTKYVAITNIDAGQTNVFSYYIQPPGLTNLVLLGSLTNIYGAAGSTNYTFPATSGSLSFPLYMGVTIQGAHTNGFYAP